MNWNRLEEWLLVRGSAKSGGWARTTVEQRLGDLKRAAAWGMDVEDFSREEGDRFIAHLHKRGISNSGLENYVVALNGLARFNDLDHQWDFPEKTQRQHDYLDDAEIRALLEYEHEQDLAHRRDRAEILLALKSALRPSEAYQLTLTDFDLDNHTLHVEKTSKSGVKRRIPIEPWVLGPNRPVGSYVRWLDRQGWPDDEPIWVTDRKGPGREHPLQPLSYDYFRDRLRRTGAMVDVEVNWQKTRRTRAQELLDEGWPVPYVSRYLGHRKLETTMTYLGISESKMLEKMDENPTEDPYQS